MHVIFTTAIYMRPRILRVHREYPELPWYETLRVAVFNDNSPLVSPQHDADTGLQAYSSGIKVNKVSTNTQAQNEAPEELPEAQDSEHETSAQETSTNRGDYLE
jgi:hypothetical protein